MSNPKSEIRDPKSTRELDPKELADAKELFFKYGEKKPHLIVREMREKGWTEFNRAELCGRRKTGRHQAIVGLIEALGWDKLIESLPPRPSGTPPDQGGEFKATFKEWLIATKPQWHWNWKYQNYIYKVLDRVTRGRVKRLMVFMPPRHGKSEMITVRFAAWMLINRPQTRIIIGSYNQKLANRFSRQIRRIFWDYGSRNENDSSVFSVDSVVNGRERPQTTERAESTEQTVSRPLNTADEWETPEGGGVKAVGAGAGVTGFGADLIIIDDPIKGRADAESKNNRDRVCEWYNDDLHTRLEPNGQIILIQTRWHMDDLAGRLLNEEENDGEKWEVIKLAALAEGEEGVATSCNFERGSSGSGGSDPDFSAASAKSAFKNPADPLNRKPGEALCPARYGREALEAKRKKLGTYSFSALYQQSPVPADGNVFKRAWFSRIVEREPDGLRYYRGYDLALSTKTSADYTVSARIAQDKDGTIYIVDIFRKRIEYPDQLRYITGRIEAERDTEHGIESALHGLAFIQQLRQNARLSSAAFRGVTVNKDKLTRCLAWANRAEEGKVVLVRGPWIADFIDECCAFPTGRHDDQIDAVSLAVEMMSRRRHVAFGF